jgi:hypothetical protein
METLNKNISFKNILQEYFQSKQLDIPSYTTKALDNSPQPQFQSTVTLDKLGSFTGHPKPQKKMAEASAAQVALLNLNLIPNNDDLSNPKNTNNTDLDIKPKDIKDDDKDTLEKYQPTQLFTFDWTIQNPIIILNDLENINKLSSLETFIQNYQLNNVKLIKIASHLTVAKKYANYVINSSNKDAADHFITYLVGLLCGSIKVPFKLIVLTSDHFGGALEDIMKYNPQIHLKHATCQDDCIDLLNTFIPNL